MTSALPAGSLLFAPGWRRLMRVASRSRSYRGFLRKVTLPPRGPRGSETNIRRIFAVCHATQVWYYHKRRQKVNRAVR